MFSLEHNTLKIAAPLKNFQLTKKLKTKFQQSFHLHSGIKFVTPNMRHEGRDIEILKSREAIYIKARQRNPERWKTQIRDWTPIQKVHLNPTREEKLKKIA